MVETESSSSQDFTDEFVDTQARVSNLKATQQALARLMEKAESIEDALKVQDELNKVLEEIEVLQGRLNLLSQTSAFSLITVDLKVDPRGDGG